MDMQRLNEVLAAAGEPAYRGSQVWEWVARGASGYEEMTNLPAGLRARLDADLPISTLSVRAEARSDDGTVKTLFDTADGRPIEAVLMRYRDGRRSVCVSSQSGCPLTCTFCATGTMKFGRNLGADEILDQALHFRRVEEIDHVVFMGMGEPTMNIDNVLAACERYRAKRRRKVFVEYVMLDHVNDLPEHARELAALLDPRIYKINLIPYNPTGAYDGSSPERIERFRAILHEHRVPATVRLTRGRDIDAACGQLAAKAAA
jgi:adenine C2-methylase RlmN of 23S rRNA A2503 and tRNA A37